MRTLAALIVLIPAIAQAADPLLVELQRPGRTWSQQELAVKLYQTCRASDAQAPKREIAAWVKLLKVDHVLKSDGTLDAKLQVREVALACIEELSGENFYPANGAEAPVRQILSTTKDGAVERFHIAEIVPKDLPAIQKAIQAWLKK